MTDVPYMLSLHHYEAEDTAMQLRVLFQDTMLYLDISFLDLEAAYIGPDRIGASVLIDAAHRALEEAIADIGQGTPRCVGRTEWRHDSSDDTSGLRGGDGLLGRPDRLLS